VKLSLLKNVREIESVQFDAPSDNLGDSTKIDGIDCQTGGVGKREEIGYHGHACSDSNGVAAPFIPAKSGTFGSTMRTMHGLKRPDQIG